jgi:DNA-binding MarR family transcriptional regulator
MGRNNAEREAQRIMEGVSTFRGPLLPTGRRHPRIPSAVEHWTGFALIVAAHAVEQRYAHAVKLVGISLRDFVLLAEIARRPGLSQTTLARRVGLTRARVSEQLTVLDTAGYVSRQIGMRDLRTRRITISSAGHQVVEEAGDRIDAIDRGFLSPIDPRLRPAFASAVKRLAPLAT